MIGQKKMAFQANRPALSTTCRGMEAEAAKTSMSTTAHQKLGTSFVGTNENDNKEEDFHQKFCEQAPRYLSEAIERSKFSPEELEQHQNDRLQAMLRYAKDHSPFYAKALRNVDITKITTRDLSPLPVLNKEIVMENWNEIVTDSRLTYKGASDHLASLLTGEKKNPVLFDEHFVFATGGSSGKRGMFVWDKELILTIIAGFYCGEAIYDATHPPESGRLKRTACIHAGEWIHGSRVVFSAKVGDDRERRVFPASLPLGELAKQLEEYGPDRINGYSSVVVELANMALDKKVDISPQMVATYGEPLEQSGRDAIKKAWGIKTVNNAYGSTDIGMIAYEGFDDKVGTMTVAEDLTLIEFVDEQNRPVEVPNEESKCLMTKLYGKAMPLFRYETTDKLIMSNGGARSSFDGRRRIERIDGRTDVWFTYVNPKKKLTSEDGREGQACTQVHPIVFRHILGQMDDIIEYQVQQTPQGANILLITKDQCKTGLCKDVQSRLSFELNKVGIENAQIVVTIVNDLPRHPETNKLRRFVPL